MCWQRFQQPFWWTNLNKTILTYSYFPSLNSISIYVLLCESLHLVPVFMCVWTCVCIYVGARRLCRTPSLVSTLLCSFVLFCLCVTVCVTLCVTVCVSADAHEPQHSCQGQNAALSVGHWLTGLRTSRDSPASASHLYQITGILGVATTILFCVGSVWFYDYDRGSRLGSSCLLGKCFKGWAISPASLPYVFEAESLTEVDSSPKGSTHSLLLSPPQPWNHSKGHPWLPFTGVLGTSPVSGLHTCSKHFANSAIAPALNSPLYMTLGYVKIALRLPILNLLLSKNVPLNNLHNYILWVLVLLIA